jgi:hypothetical protein
LRHDKLKQLRDEAKLISSELENVEHNIATINTDYEREKELKHLARLLYAGKIVEKAGLLYSFNEQTLLLFLADNKHTIQQPTKML